ncbi:unnamed protein product [Symbiodinium microadriaticum]|nr:unnamed protein product [Symbiodinium microadriaticum]CAE7369234.1 unnamed protein product [Symbiodinium sp. KB8]
MPRSAPLDSSSDDHGSYDSDADFLSGGASDSDVVSAFSGDDADDEEPAAPTAQPLAGAHEQQGPQMPDGFHDRSAYRLPPDYPQMLERMACTALRTLCFFYLAQHLHFRYPDKRSAQARYNAQRRARGHQDPGDVYSFVYVQLAAPLDEHLDGDYQALAGLLDRGIPENDLGWITRIGGSSIPQRHVYLQYLAMYIRRSLRRHLQAASADHLAKHMVEVAREMDLFYIPTLLSLFPLLDDDGRRDFQQWFYGYTSRGSVPAASSAASSAPEPASGSGGICGQDALKLTAPCVDFAETAVADATDQLGYATPPAYRQHPRPYKASPDLPTNALFKRAWESATAHLPEAVGQTGYVGIYRVLRLFALSMILHDHIRPELHQFVSTLPQMAYLEGGVLLSVDLRQAFDVMPRDRLREALQLAQIHPAAQYVILQLHAHASIRIAHGHCRATLDTTNGIRQGCCLAPALWVLYTGLIMTYLKTQLSMHDTTVYADDFLFHWMVNSCEQLEGAFHNIAFVLRTLDRFGMRPSPSKSAVMIGVRGTRIGAVLSYGQFEAQTLKERVKQSWSAFNRLLPALRSSGVSLKHRVLTWRTCVHSVLVHGLDSIGLAPGGATKLHKHVLRQLRILSKAPSFITREPARALLARLQVEEPLQPCNMEPNRDAIREGASEVASQELMSAAEQASLLSSMMGKNPATPPRTTATAHPSEASTRDHTPAPEQVAPTRDQPDPMDIRETKRQAELSEEALQVSQRGNGKGGDKWPRSQSKGNARSSDGGWGRDHRAPAQRRHHSRQWDWDKDKEDKTFDRATDRKLYELCLAMSRLIMRHEDQMSINRAQDNFVMFAQTQGVLSAIPELFKATEAWRQMKKEQPEVITLPLRTWLLKHWVDLMLLKQMQTLILQPLAVLRFHTTRELVQNMQSDVVPLMLQIGSRTAECHQLWNGFYRLSHSGACRVVATSLRGDRMGRSALAQAIQRMIEDM